MKPRIPVTLNTDLLPFRAINQKSELKGDLLASFINCNFSVDLSNSWKQKLLYNFAKETVSDCVYRSARNKSREQLFLSPAIMKKFAKETPRTKINKKMLRRVSQGPPN